MNADEIDALLVKLAAKHCHVTTLEPRGRDALDFHDVGVVGLKRALAEAFEAGRQQGRVEMAKGAHDVMAKGRR